MRRSAILLAGTAALLAAPVAAQVTDFRLPPGPTPTPRVVGPLPDTPVPRPSPAPTPAPTATPTAAAPTPAPSATSAGTPSPTASAPPRATAVPAPRATGPSPAPAPATLAPPAVASTTSPAPVATPSAASAPAAVPEAIPPESAAPEAPRHSWWPWIALIVIAAAAAAAAALFWLRRRVGPLGPVVVPEIERPRVPAAPPAEPATSLEPTAPAVEPEPPDAPPAEAHPLHIAIELRKLSLTLMNATLGYRLTLTNAGPEPLPDIAVGADLIGAHASLPREAQLAGPTTELPVHHRLAGLAPGESGDVAGELRLPLSELRPIVQGRSQLFVPLARFRIGADGQEPRCFTLVAGQPSPSGTGAIQPVRLDLGPRIYDGLAGRAF